MATDELEFEDANEDDWGELEELDEGDENMKNLYERTENNQCWKCKHCESINNIKLTIDTIDMTCINCNQDRYIPDQTKIIFSSEWITSKDKTNQDSGSKSEKTSWSCKSCSWLNTNVSATKCEFCNALRFQTNNLTQSKNQMNNNNNVNPTINNDNFTKPLKKIWSNSSPSNTLDLLIYGYYRFEYIDKHYQSKTYQQ